jgi:hypothetical protein
MKRDGMSGKTSSGMRSDTSVQMPAHDGEHEKIGGDGPLRANQAIMRGEKDE